MLMMYKSNKHLYSKVIFCNILKKVLAVFCRIYSVNKTFNDIFRIIKKKNCYFFILVLLNNKNYYLKKNYLSFKKKKT